MLRSPDREEETPESPSCLAASGGHSETAAVCREEESSKSARTLILAVSASRAMLLKLPSQQYFVTAA